MRALMSLKYTSPASRTVKLYTLLQVAVVTHLLSVCWLLISQSSVNNVDSSIFLRVDHEEIMGFFAVNQSCTTRLSGIVINGLTSPFSFAPVKVRVTFKNYALKHKSRHGHQRQLKPEG